MLWLYYASGSIIFFTSLNLLQRKIAVEGKNPRATAIVFNSIAVLLALSLFFILGGYKNFTLPVSSSAWLSLALACLFYALFERGRFIAAKELDASVYSTITNVSVLVAFIGSIFLYSESLTIQKILGAGLIILALFLISLGHISSKVSAKGIIIAVLICTSLGLGWMLDKKGALYFNPDTYNIFVWTLPLVIIYFPYVKTKEIVSEFKRSTLSITLLAGMNVSGYLLQLKALEISEATKVIPIVQTSTLFTVLFGILLFKEREHMIKKFIAGILAVSGVFFLSQ